MSLIKVIPIGQKYRDNRENLMYKAKISMWQNLKKN